MSSLHIDQVDFKLSQEGNTLGTTSEIETMEISFQTQIDSLENEPGFIVLKSETGWSFDSVEEIEKLVEKLANMKLKLFDNN